MDIRVREQRAVKPHFEPVISNPATCRAAPARDAAGVVGLEQVSGPGNAHSSDGRVVVEAFLGEGKLLELYERDVVLVGGGDVAAETRGLFLTQSLDSKRPDGSRPDSDLGWMRMSSTGTMSVVP